MSRIKNYADTNIASGQDGIEFMRVKCSDVRVPEPDRNDNRTMRKAQ